MASANWDKSMEWLAGYEGGKVDDKDDPGGRTNRGVTQRVYSAFRRANGQHPRDVYLMNDDEHDDIYLEQYARPVWYNRLPSGVDACVFDYAVHSGVRRAVKDMQRSVGVEDDGIMGNVTMAAVLDYCDRKSAAELIVEICERRMQLMRGLKHWWKYKNGWTRRVMGDDISAGGQVGDMGIVDRGIMLTRGRTSIPAPKKPVAGKATGPRRNHIATAFAQILGALMGGEKWRRI